MDMGNIKCKCLVLPAQSGKTRKVEEMIRANQHLSSIFDGEEDINIWLSSNNKMLTAQTGARVQNDLGLESEPGANDACINGKIFSWMSGTKDSNIHTDSLVLKLIKNEVDMVLICAQHARIKYLVDVIKGLLDVPFFKKKISIWIDEADKSVQLWSKYEEFIELPRVRSVTLISATIGKLIKKYPEIYVIPIQETYPSCYRGLDSSIKIECDFVGTPSEYIEHIIETNPQLSTPGSKAFIPGSSEITSHDTIANFLHEKGFVVILINGTRKEILIPGKKPINLRNYFIIKDDKVPEELNTLLAKLYFENKWVRYPLAITGRYCVERGITFQCKPNGFHHGFIFDYAIIPPISNGDEAYQAMARVFGNIGDFLDYKPVKIFSTSCTFSRVEKKEACAINLARIVAEETLDFITKKEIKQAENYNDERNFDLYKGEFESFEDMNKFLESHSIRIRKRCDYDKNEQGFILSSLTKENEILDYNKTKNELHGWSKLSGFDAKKTIKGSSRVFVCYKDTSDNSTCVYICRVIKRKSDISQ